MYLVYNMMRFVSSRGLMCVRSSDCWSISAMSPEMGAPIWWVGKFGSGR